MSQLDELVAVAPRSLFRAISKFVSKHADRSRHDDAVLLAEAISAHLASIAFAGYRATAITADENVEAFLADSQRQQTLVGGSFSQLTQMSVPLSTYLAAASGTRVPGVAPLRTAHRVLAGLGLVDHVKPPIERALRGGNDNSLPLLHAIRVFENYRNKAVAHPAASEWPVEARDYYEVMVPIVEAALDALAGATAPLFGQFSIAEVQGVEDTGEGYVHRLRAERGGLPRAVTVTCRESAFRRWQSPEWQVVKGGLVLLGDGDELLGPFVNLLTLILHGSD